MITIDPASGLTTVIVVFDVEPEKQDVLLGHIKTFIEGSVKGQPGLVSATLHKSEDGRRVLNYAQWESREAYQAFLEKTAGNEAFAPIAAFRPDGRIFQIAFSTG